MNISLPESRNVDVEYILDTTTTLETDHDTSNDPSGSLAINGMASQGKLNSLDTDDYWSMKLTGGEIYTVRATDFSQLSDVSLLVDHHELDGTKEAGIGEQRMLTRGYSLLLTKQL